MNLIEPMKPLMDYMSRVLIEIRDTTLLSLYFGIPITIFTSITKWVYAAENVDYVRIVLTAIAIDHVLGTIAHSRWFKDDFSMLKNIGGLGIKILVVVTMGKLFDDMATLTSSEDFVYKYLLISTRIIVFLYPARSAMRNCYIVTRGAFPPKIIMERSDKAFNNMDLRELGKKEDNNQNNNNYDTDSTER